MQLRLPLYIGGALLAACMAGCNSSSEPYTVVTNNTAGYGAYVNSFALEADTSVLVNLDTVFFSIDLDKGRIFNADSLPKGTRINKLVVKIGLPSVREAKLIVPPAEGKSAADTIDYLENPNDTVNFSRGAVTLRVVSPNGEVTRDYEVKVNVHNEVSDTLFWNQTAQTSLPTTLSTVTAQGTAEIDGTIVCLTADGNGSFARATTDDPFTGQWTTAAASLPPGAKVESLTAAGGSLYMIDSADNLYKSTDKGSTWTATGSSMCHLLASNAGTLLGLQKQGDKYYHVTYPASTTKAASTSFPVSGTSQCIEYTSDWSTTAMTVIMGGTTASGAVSGATWAYDGGQWAEISNTPVPDITGLTLFPYFSFRVNDAWVVTKHTVLMAFGGMKADGSMNRQTYISYDQGVNWTASGALLNLPDEITPFYGAEAIVREQTLPLSRAAGTSVWALLPQRRLPLWYAIVPPATGSRAVRPIDKWECPYIYLFGGYNAQGKLSTSLWRGVINRLTFKPLQ